MATAVGYVFEALTVIVGGVVAGSKGRGKKPKPSDEEVVTGAPPGGNRGPMIPPLLIPNSTSTSTENVGTNRYNDNQDDPDERCKLYPYKDRKKECPNGNSHHAIPDHCWRAGSGIQKLLSQMYGTVGEIAGQALDDATPSKSYYYDKMNKDEGLAICVDGKGKTLTHGAIHGVFDKEEARLGEQGDPKWTAPLGKMEDAAAKSIADITGCDPAKLKEQLRKHHQGKALDEKSMLRADPYGKNTTSMTDWKADPVFKDRAGGSVD